MVVSQGLRYGSHTISFRISQRVTVTPEINCVETDLLEFIISVA